MKSDDVAHYLQDNPQFFEEHADLMANMVVPHPHGGRTISITERQMLALRDKNKQLESKMGELLQFGEENDGISEKMHRLAVGMIAAGSFQAVLHTLNFQNGLNAFMITAGLGYFNSTGNPDLGCVMVDDVALAQANFQVDPWTGFSLDCAVGMEENSEPELTIFPNPATDRVTIAAVGMDVAQAVLTDASGARIRSLDLSQGRTSFSVSSLNAGMYFLELKGKEGRVLRERIVLQGP